MAKQRTLIVARSLIRVIAPHTGDAQPELHFLDIAAALAIQVAATLSVSRGEDIAAHQRPKRDKDTFAGSAVAHEVAPETES